MGGSRGGAGGRDSPEKSQIYRVSLQYWFESPEKSQSYQATLNVGPSSAHQQTPFQRFRWRANDGPFIAVFVSSITLSTKKKNVIKFGPTLK